MNTIPNVGSALGDGLGVTQRFLEEFISPLFGMDSNLEDGYRTSAMHSPFGIVITTDAFLVDPIEFPGGNLGSLAAAGSMNDLVASGAKPLYVALSVITSEYLREDAMIRCLESIAKEVSLAGAQIVCGDTKTHPFRNPKLVLSTTGIGLPITSNTLDLKNAVSGDDIWVTGPLGNHSIAVLSSREGLGFESVVRSDCAVLLEPMAALIDRDLVHAMRDLTRGGLLAAAADGVRATGKSWIFQEECLPIERGVRAAAEMLGLDVLALTNEGSMMVIASREHRGTISKVLEKYPSTKAARVVGYVGEQSSEFAELVTETGGQRALYLPDKLGIPRLC